MATKMVTLADKLLLLREKKAAWEEKLDILKGEIETTEQKLIEVMTQTDTQNFTHSGTQFSIRTSTHASTRAGMKADLFRALRGEGYGELITETINANTLTAFVKEQREANDGELPEWMTDLVSVYDEKKISVRKSR